MGFGEERCCAWGGEPPSGLGGGMAVLSPCTIPWDPCVPVGMLGWGGRGGGTKGLTRGSLLPLRRDLNQTERFCHPSH